jgi:hypothetical protein
MARITSYLFVISNKSLFQIKIAKSIDNQPFNKKKKDSFFFLLFFLDFLLTNPDMNLDRQKDHNLW